MDLGQYLNDNNSDVLNEIRKTGKLEDDLDKKLGKAIQDFKDTLDYLEKEVSDK
jgi:F0F1-type ATP synthase alpha subunit